MTQYSIDAPETGALRRAGRSPVVTAIGKACVALAVFASIFGGWLFVVQSRAATRAAAARLPGYAAADACAVWFVGSSSIHKWTTLETDMAPWPARNRGVNGALMPELLQMMRNEPHGTPPRAIIFYAGENDIAHGASAADDIGNLRAFLTLTRRRWGNVPVAIVSLKPTPTRWGNLPEQTAFNTAARDIAARMPSVTFVDVVPSFLVNHRPGPFYVDDGIHLNPAGYTQLTRAIRPMVQTMAPLDAAGRCDRRQPNA